MHPLGARLQHLLSMLFGNESEHVVGESSQIGSGFFIREPYALGNQKQKMKIKKMQGRL